MTEGGKQPQIRIAGLRNIPIVELDINNDSQKEKYDNIIELVEEMLEINIQYCNTNLTHQQKAAIKQKIKFIYSQIDEIVFDLYNISDDEIKEIKIFLN